MRHYVINLDTRADRMRNFEAESSKAGITFERISATTPKECNIPRSFKLPPASYANGQSHKRIWQMIADSGEEYGCIFEDDAVYMGWGQFDADALTTELVNAVGPVDMLFLGGNHTMHGAERGERIHGNLWRCRHTLTGHAYIVSRWAAQWLIDHVPYHTHAVDAGWKALHDMGRSYYYDPAIWVQRPDYSDIWGRHVDYRDCIR